MADNERAGPQEEEAGPAGRTGSVARPSDSRAARVRRWARRELDQVLAGEIPPPAEPPPCDGRHHPGERCDWWRTCTGLSLGVAQRDVRGRELLAVGWAP